MAFAARWRSAVAFDATEQFLAIARVETEHRGLRNIEFRYGPIVGITGKVYVSPVLRRPGVSLGQA